MIFTSRVALQSRGQVLHQQARHEQVDFFLPSNSLQFQQPSQPQHQGLQNSLPSHASSPAEAFFRLAYRLSAAASELTSFFVSVTMWPGFFPVVQAARVVDPPRRQLSIMRSQEAKNINDVLERTGACPQHRAKASLFDFCPRDGTKTWPRAVS